MSQDISNMHSIYETVLVYRLFLAGLDFSACEVQNIGELANLNPQIFFK